MRFFRSQFEEIRSDQALRFYGVALALAHLLVFVFWADHEFEYFVTDPASAISWPFFETSFEYRYLKGETVSALFVVGMMLSLVGAALFFWKRATVPACLWLLALNLLRLLIWAQDYRLRANQHYFLTVFCLAYLFLPDKRNLLRYLFVFVYFWAGLLKLNPEWLSGAALYKPPIFVPEALIPASCVYVVVLEIVFAWGLLAHKRWIYWPVFAQVCLFHLISWSIVGYFYPLLMFLLLAIYPLARFIEGPGNAPSLGRALLTGRPPLTTYAFLLLFSALQFAPYLMPGDHALTGQGRVFAMHMFDAKTECEGTITLRFREGDNIEIPLPIKTSTRLRCDPAVYFSMAKRLCWEHRNEPNFEDLDLRLHSRRTTDGEMQTVIDIRNFKKRDLSYKVFWHNDWIESGP